MSSELKLCGLCVYFGIEYSAPDNKGRQYIHPWCKLKNKGISPNGTCMNFKRKEQK